jgi:hypothetical protein
MGIIVGNVAGPVAPGDFLFALLSEPVSLRTVITGRTINPIPGQNVVTLGVNEQSNQIEAGMLEGWPDGTPMQLLVQQLSSSLAIVDSVGPVAYGVWDPTSSVWGLLSFVERRTDAQLAQVLAAVTYTFPTTT